MLKRRKVGVALATLLFAGLAFADGTAEKPDKKDGDEVVCKRETTTGTRFAKKVCMTRAQRAATAREASDSLGDLHRRGVHGNPSEGSQ